VRWGTVRARVLQKSMCNVSGKEGVASHTQESGGHVVLVVFLRVKVSVFSETRRAREFRVGNWVGIT